MTTEIIRPSPTSSRSRLIRQTAIVAGPVMAIGLVRGVMGAARYPTTAYFAVGCAIGLLLVIAGFAALQLAYRRNFSVRREAGELVLTTSFGRSRRYLSSGLRLILIKWSNPMAFSAKGSIDYSYGFVLDSSGKVLTGLSGSYYLEEALRRLAESAGIRVEGGWDDADSRTLDEVKAWYPGIRRWWTVRQALAIPVVLVMLLPAVLLAAAHGAM